MPLALFALFARLGFIVPSDLLGMQCDWTVVGVLLVLAVAEIAIDKVRALDPGFSYAMVVVRGMAGAALFETMLEPGAFVDAGAVPGLVFGAGIAVLVAVLKVITRPASRAEAAGVSTAFLSGLEDVVAVVGGAVGIFLPFVPLLLVGFLLFFFNRIRKRRGRKYEGLRILGD